ncbi:hypothetical protein EJB05_27527, partial [Eragrostis curvula]
MPPWINGKIFTHHPHQAAVRGRWRRHCHSKPLVYGSALALLIWHVRNDIVHNQKLNLISSSVSFLLNYDELLLWIRQPQWEGKGKVQAVVHNGQTNRRPIIKKPDKWEPPPMGWVTINVDGTYSANDGRAGIGVVIRDSNGKVLLSSWWVIFDAISAEEVESWACKEGISLAAE